VGLNADGLRISTSDGLLPLNILVAGVVSGAISRINLFWNNLRWLLSASFSLPALATFKQKSPTHDGFRLDAFLVRNYAQV
jgi:hypothetical protein